MQASRLLFSACRRDTCITRRDRLHFGEATGGLGILKSVNTSRAGQGKPKNRPVVDQRIPYLNYALPTSDGNPRDRDDHAPIHLGSGVAAPFPEQEVARSVTVRIEDLSVVISKTPEILEFPNFKIPEILIWPL